ncbi:hypothetical protein [Microbacterium sp. NPDC057650]|uniref:hypothetical protein n=1 Tax=unclassified Microbacterium TaxID=2609290 RepID=UPI003670B374
MNDTELDDLLARAAQPLPIAADNLAAAVADDIARGTRARRRRRWLIPVVIAGAFALTAGASLTAIQLAEWQGVSMPEGHVRSTVPIPLEWVTEDGHAERCGAWIELSDAEPGDQAALDDAIRAHDWAGFGQRLYDTGAPVADDPDGSGRTDSQLGPELRAFAEQAIPGVGWMAEGAGRTAVAAYGFRCTTDVP